MKGLTQKEYARRRRISAPYVNKLVKQGRIRLNPHGRVDPGQADGARARQQAVAARPPVRSNARGNSHGGGRPPRQPGAPGTASGNATLSLTAARAADAGYQARLRKMEYEERSKQLLPASEVLEAERRKNANIKVRFRGLARALAEPLARTAVPAECERLLLEEIDYQLDELARDPLGLVGPAVPAPPPAAAVQPAEVSA